jgi:hypothetical protein
LGFVLYKATSTIPEAGQGLFIKGRCSLGSVVALYPGIIYYPSEWESKKCFVSHLKKDCECSL